MAKERKLRPVSSEELAEVFAGDGPLAAAFADYEHRADQLKFAGEIANALGAGRHALLEAGTGMGKTYGYLVPLLLSGARVQLTTSTRNLQEQLVARDIPQLLGALKLSAEVRMLKGRANYICKKRLIDAREHDVIEELFPDLSQKLAADLAQVAEHALISKDGDIAGVKGVRRFSKIWPLVTSTRANCAGSRCDHYEGCFFYDAVKRAQRADLVVANHALTMVSTTHELDLMGSFDAILFDEAHELVEGLPRYFAKQINLKEQRNLFAESRALLGGVLAAEVVALIAGISKLLDELAAQAKEAARRHEDRAYREARPLRNEDLTGKEAYRASLADLQGQLARLVAQLPDPPEDEQQARPRAGEGEDGAARPSELKAHAEELAAELRLWHGASDEIFAWVEAGEHSVTYWRVPANAAALFRKYLLAQQPTLCVSSTLAAGGSLAYPSMILGMEEAVQGIWESPFDYAGNALVWLPPELPPPTAARAEHVRRSVDLALELITANRGRAFLLFATLSSMKLATKRLRARLDDAYTLLVQDDDDARALVERFARADGNPKVLVGSKTFWQGVDVPGEALSLVLIDKIPFAPPADPIQYMRTTQLSDPGSAFTALAVPRATMQLKQAAGRLIRSASDRGVLVLCDPRLAGGYGRRIMDSLQPMRRARSKQELLDFIGEGA